MALNAAITINLQDRVYNNLKYLARLTHRNLADVLADRLESSLIPVSILSDKEVLNLSHKQMDEIQDQRLTVLLDHQQSGNLTSSEQPELQTLMQMYQDGLLRKAQALHEAVKRGLREPLTI